MTPEYEDLCCEYSREYLRHIAAVEQNIKDRQIELDFLRERLCGVSGIDYSKDKIKVSPTPDAIPNGVIEMIEIESDIREQQQAYERERDECYALLRKVDDIEGIVLRLHYIYGEKISGIAEKFDKSTRTIYSLKRAGEIALYELGLPTQFRIPLHSAL